MNNQNDQFNQNAEFSYQTENNSDFTTVQTNDFDVEKKVQEIKDISQVSMILGIVAAAIIFVCPCLFIASIILGCLSISKYVKAKKLLENQKVNGELTAALVCSIVALCLSGLYTLLALFYIAIFGFGVIIGFMAL